MKNSEKILTSYNQGISFKPVLNPSEILDCAIKLKKFHDILSKMCKRKFDGVVVHYLSNCSKRLNAIMDGVNYSTKPISLDGFVFYDEAGGGFCPERLCFEDLAYIIDNLIISLMFIIELNEFMDNKINREPTWTPLQLFINKEHTFINNLKEKISLTY